MNKQNRQNMVYPMISVGFKNTVARNRIVAVISPHSRPVRTLINEAKNGNKLVDATLGKKTKSVVVMDSDHVVLSTNTVETITQRIQDSNFDHEQGE